MIPGTFDRSSVLVRVVTSGLAGIVTRRGHCTRLAVTGPVRGPDGSRPAALRVAGRAVTVQAPGLTPRTSAVTATGPLPGTIPSTVSSREKESPAPLAPAASVRCPVNRIVAVNGSPASPGSSQYVTVSSCSRALAAHTGTSSAPLSAACSSAACSSAACSSARSAGISDPGHRARSAEPANPPSRAVRTGMSEPARRAVPIGTSEPGRRAGRPEFPGQAAGRGRVARPARAPGPAVYPKPAPGSCSCSLPAASRTFPGSQADTADHCPGGQPQAGLAVARG